jgi:hypothetical protein
MKSLSVFSFLTLFFLSPLLIQAQNNDPKPPSTEAEFEKKYQRNIKKERLHGVYIPKDLADAFIQLNILIDKSSQTKFKSMAETEAVKKLHFSFGRWITHNWSLYSGSRYSHYVKSVGIYHPEEMASFTILMYHRYLNKNKLDVKGYMEDFKKKKEEARQKKNKKGKVLETFKRKRKN